MKAIRIITKWILTIILIPVVYLLVSLILTIIPVNKEEEYSEKNQSIYINSNGVHLNIILHKNQLDLKLLSGLRFFNDDNYLSFGWGDREFYLNTPEWSDLTFNNAFQALFLKSSTLIHLSRYSRIEADWTEIKLSQNQLIKINEYIYKSFYSDSMNNKILLINKGYTFYDDFYEATGTYTCFKTSNSWVNTGLKNAGIKACLWTPFDFGLLRIHKKKTSD